MNIFILDREPWTAAQYHCDKHLGKMILEGAQMLSTALYELNRQAYQGLAAVDGIYKPTHVNHPCSIWVRQSMFNAEWLVDLCISLDLVRRDQGKKKHASLAVVLNAYDRLLLASFPNKDITPFALAMPETFSKGTIDPVEAYRDYYASKAEQFPLTYQGREMPEWLLKRLHSKEKAQA